ncbi:hypothetical protein ACLOJK_029032 [Asimina triloba]
MRCVAVGIKEEIGGGWAGLAGPLIGGGQRSGWGLVSGSTKECPSLAALAQMVGGLTSPRHHDSWNLPAWEATNSPPLGLASEPSPPPARLRADITGPDSDPRLPPPQLAVGSHRIVPYPAAAAAAAAASCFFSCPALPVAATHTDPSIHPPSPPQNSSSSSSGDFSQPHELVGILWHAPISAQHSLGLSMGGTGKPHAYACKLLEKSTATFQEAHELKSPHAPTLGLVR